jgi:hypothetical protein
VKGIEREERACAWDEGWGGFPSMELNKGRVITARNKIK